MDRRFEIEVEASENKLRLEDLLLDRFRTLSKLYLREVVKQGRCEVNGRLENRGYRLKTNDFIEVELDPDRQNSMVPEDIDIQIVHNDPHFMVVNKPVGMLVHPSHRDKSGTVLNALSYSLNRHAEGPHVRPGLVHRLDKETSGLLVISKNTRAHGKLATQFERKQVDKLYLAMVNGVVAEEAGMIEQPIGRFADEKRWGVRPDGKPSETKFRVLKRSAATTLLELEPVTGRTNQLRIHCAAIGHPIVGDTARGGTAYRRLCLHACKLSFRHPVTRAMMEFQTRADFDSGE